MKKVLISILTFLTLLTYGVVFARTMTYVCPKSYKTVVSGYSIQQVEAACGKPVKRSNHESIQTKPEKLIQWIYTEGKRIPNEFSPQMIVTFADNKVIQIRVTDQSKSARFPCYNNGRIKIGTGADEVKLMCGAPAHENNISRAKKIPVKETSLTYNFGSYRPTVIFVFQNDKLIDIKSGPIAK